MKRLLASMALAFHVTAFATPQTTDWSDIWLDSAEPGWGVTIYQQSSTLFVTFFIYDQAGRPHWYFSDGLPFTGSTGSTQNFSGPLYETQGTYFAAPWNSSLTGIRQVGTLSIAFPTIASGIVTYSVDGLVVSKPIQRYTFKVNSMAGNYVGGSVGTYSGCGAASGYQEEPAAFAITHSSAGVVNITAQGNGNTCFYAGSYSQSGKFGGLAGTLSCSRGDSGTFQAFEIDSQLSSLSARATANYGGGCTWSGRLGGLRRGT